MDAKKQQRRHRTVTVVTSAVLGLCVLGVLWVFDGVRHEAQAEHDRRSQQRIDVAADLLAERIRHLGGLAQSLVVSEPFRRPTDAALDDTRLQRATPAQASTISTFDGIQGWLPDEDGEPVSTQLPLRPFIWQFSRGLPIRTASGRFLARTRRLQSSAIIEANPDVLRIAEVDSSGRIVFAVPYSAQVRLRAFNLAERLGRANLSLDRTKAHLWAHDSLIVGSSVDEFTIITPIERSNVERFLFLSTASESIRQGLTDKSVNGALVGDSGAEVLQWGSSRSSAQTTSVRRITIGLSQFEARLSTSNPPLTGSLSSRLLIYCGLLVATFIAFNFVSRQLLWWTERYHLKLESVERDVQKKARELAHDFQNTAFALRAFMSSIFSGLDFEQQKRFTAVFTDLGAFIHQLSNNLAADALDLAGLPGGIQAEPRSEATYLRGILEGVAQLQSAVLARPIPITFDESLSRSEPFVDISRPDLIRIVSNILTNAIEACKVTNTNGITIGVSRQGTSVRVRFIDDGCGIEPSDQLRIFEADYSTKSVERGKGLSLAKELSQKANGDLLLEASAPGKGTIIALLVRTTVTPQWFVNTIPITTGTTLVVVDDEDEVAGYWARTIDDRFKGMVLPMGQRPRLISISSPSELRTNRDNALRDGTLFLIDHRFRNDPESGITLIAELKLQDKAILVTNLFEEPEIIDEVIRLGVRLLPKMYMLNTKFPIDISEGSEGVA